MAEIVNLRQMRKRKAQLEKERRAEENRVRFGRTKAQKKAQSLQDAKAARELEGHRREPRDGE